MKKTCELTLDPPNAMKGKTVLRKTCLCYQNLTSQTHSLSCTRHSARLQKHTYPLLHNFSRPFRLGTVLYIHAEISEKHVQHTFCSAPLFHFTFFPQSVKSSLNLFPEQKVQERERERVCVVEASEHSRHKRSVKRPLPLFCILVPPPPSSAPLSCPPLSETQPCSRAEAIWNRPKSTANAVHVCVWERERSRIKIDCLHCITFASPQRMKLCKHTVCLRFWERTNGSRGGLLGAIGKKRHGGRRKK